MEPYLSFITTLVLYLSSIIFIIAAYLLQILSEKNNWKSQLLLATKSMLISLSVLSVSGSTLLYLIFRPF